MLPFELFLSALIAIGFRVIEDDGVIISLRRNDIMVFQCRHEYGSDIDFTLEDAETCGIKDELMKSILRITSKEEGKE